MSVNKIEVVDFLINVLKEHEDILGSLIDKVEKILIENQEKNDTSLKSYTENNIINLTINKWSEFINQIYQPEFACFDYSNNFFQVTAKKGNLICTYRIKTTQRKNNILKNKSSENINAFNSNEQNSTQEILNNINPENTKTWLSRQLRIDEKSIIFGKIGLIHSKS